MTSIPIVFVLHYKNIMSDDILLHIKNNNPNIYLLTSDSNTNSYPPDIIVDDLNRYCTLFEYFVTNIYKHMSTNPESLELLGFQRLFVLYEFMLYNQFDSIFYCDNNVLLNVNINSLDFDFSKPHYCIPDNSVKYRCSASIHTSILPIDFLDDLINFIFDTYKNNINVLKDKYTYHIDNNKDGGICDMTFLYLFSLENDVTNMLDLNFDHGINTSESRNLDHYKMINCNKIIKIESNVIYTELSNNTECVLHSLKFGNDNMIMFDEYLKLLKK